MVHDINYEELSSEFLKQLPRGAFLTVKAGEKINTMTIGWGSIGYMWRRPVMAVMVRYSRYTYELLESGHDFTVSIPMNSEMESALKTAGTVSGRDTDKFAASGITASKSQKIESPGISECGLVYECKILFRQAMDSNLLNEEIREKFYADNNLHVIYYGEIVACHGDI